MSQQVQIVKKFFANQVEQREPEAEIQNLFNTRRAALANGDRIEQEACQGDWTGIPCREKAMDRRKDLFGILSGNERVHADR